MPSGDRTGPNGRGPKTGRGLGDCDEKDVKENQKEEILRPRFGRRLRRRTF